MTTAMGDIPVFSGLDRDGKQVSFREFRVGTEYKVIMPADGHLIVTVGMKYPAAGKINLRDTKVVAARDAVFEFKHSNHSGRKWWTAAPGREFVFVIPVDKIAFHAEIGYSYPKVRIGECDTSFNCTGGTCGGMWCDSVSHGVHTLLAGSKRMFKQINDAAMSLRDALHVANAVYYLQPQSDGADAHWRSLMADKLIDLSPGKQVVAGNGLIGTITESYPTRQRYIARFEDGQYRFRRKDVAALETAKLQGIEVPVPMVMNWITERANTIPVHRVV